MMTFEILLIPTFHALYLQCRQLPARLFSLTHVMNMRGLLVNQRASMLVLCVIVSISLSGCVSIVEATAPVREILYDETGLPHGEVSCHLANSLLKQFKITLALRDAAPNAGYTFWMSSNEVFSMNLAYLITNRNGDLNFHVHQYLGSGSYTVYFHLDQDGSEQYKTDWFSFTIP